MPELNEKRECQKRGDLWHSVGHGRLPDALVVLDFVVMALVGQVIAGFFEHVRCAAKRMITGNACGDGKKSWKLLFKACCDSFGLNEDSFDGWHVM